MHALRLSPGDAPGTTKLDYQAEMTLEIDLNPMLATALAYLVMWGWQRPVYPGHFDALTFYIVQSLQTPISDQIAFAIAQIGSPLIYLPFAVVLAAVLAVMGNWRAATHWMVALGFSALVALGLRWWLAIPAPSGYFHGDATDPLFLAGGGQDLILCATVYGMAGLMIAAGQPLTARPYYHSITVAGVVLIALARLYLGLDWASDLLIGLAIAFVWLNMLVLSYRRQERAWRAGLDQAPVDRAPASDLRRVK